MLFLSLHNLIAKNRVHNYLDVSIVSEGGTSLSNFSRAFIHQQYRTSNDACGLDDAGDNVELISNTHLRLRSREINGDRYKVVWIIENLQFTGKTMSVEHGWFSLDDGGSSEEHVWTQTITEVNSMDATSLFAQASTDGSGTWFPRGSTDYWLTSTTEITFTECDHGQEKLITYDVVQWPSAGSGGPIQDSGVVRPDNDIGSSKEVISLINLIWEHQGAQQSYKFRYS